MSEIQFYELKCKRCGGQLEQNGAIYKCESCGKIFEKQVVTDVADQLRAVLNEQKQEAVANLRQQLWAEMHAQYINSEKITDLARDIKKYLPDDYFANFCEVANNGNDRQVSHFLNNTPQSAMADYADIVLDFMLKSVTASNLNAISLFIDRAFKGDTQNYDKYMTRYEEEAQKVSSGIYELILTRDVFLAYSSADIDKVIELCDFLERNKITCFLALRNLRHGRGAVDNYDQALKTAIDNCKTVVFVSSTYSRSLTCDALTKELPYIRQKDIDGAPAEFRRAYDKMPSDYMMPRVEYLIEDYSGDVAEMMTKEFFHGIEWCKSKEAVAARITGYLTETHETAAQRAERENREFQQQLEEERRKAEEVKTRAKELELKIAEAEKARLEAERRATEVRNIAPVDSGDKEDPDAKYCKKCRTANRKNAKFCSSCGSGEFFASFGEYVASKIKFCALCGAQNNVEDKFCAECGSKEFVPTKKAYEDLKAQIAEEERQRKIREEQEKRRKEEAERKRQEEERKRKEEAERLRKIREEQERLRREEEERLRKIREEEERKRKEEEERLRKLREGFDIQSGVLVKYKGEGGDVVIPDDVTSIGKSAFSGCTSLTSITIPDGVTSIGKYAFFGCTSITSVTIGKSVKTIEDSTFSGCTSITSVTVPDSVTSIDHGAFNSCSSLTSITIPNSVKTIEASTFSGCTSLTSITIPDGVTSIGEYAFFGCTSITSVTIGKSVKTIEDSTFSGCTSITSVTVPDSVTSIGNEAFFDCTSLTSVTIGKSVTSIGNKAFFGCTSLTSVTIGRSVISIGNSAFYFCKALPSITIPYSVKFISDGAFDACDSLRSINVSTENRNFKSIDGVLYSYDGKTLVMYPMSKGAESFTIPDSVTTIGEGAFLECERLTRIIIPYGVTFIGNNAFRSCKNLKTIYCRVKKPLIGLPKSWDNRWLGDADWNRCKAQVIWNYKGN